jgi:hypothetical protein
MKSSKTAMLVIFVAMGLIIPFILVFLGVSSPISALTGTLIILSAIEVAKRRNIEKPKN